MSLEDVAPRTYASLARFSDGAREPLPDGLAALIDIRVSQLNGCAYCLEMHYPQARAAGVDQRRLDTLPAWRDSPLFSPASGPRSASPRPSRSSGPTASPTTSGRRPRRASTTTRWPASS